MSLAPLDVKLRLPQDQEIALDSADVITLQGAVASYNSSPASFTMDEATRTVLLKLTEWPPSKRFPALDIIRILSLRSSISFLLPEVAKNLKSQANASAKEHETNSMLALRAVANAFSSDEGGMIKGSEAIVSTLADTSASTLSKIGRTALATCLLKSVTQSLTACT